MIKTTPALPACCEMHAARLAAHLLRSPGVPVPRPPGVSSAPAGQRNLIHVRFAPEATEVLRCRENEAAPLFDHLVGAGDDRRGNFEAERLGRFEVYDQFELGRLLHGQVSRFLALEDAIDVAGARRYWSIGSGP